MRFQLALINGGVWRTHGMHDALEYGFRWLVPSNVPSWWFRHHSFVSPQSCSDCRRGCIRTIMAVVLAQHLMNSPARRLLSLNSSKPFLALGA